MSLKAEYEFAIFNNNMISQLMKNELNSSEMSQLLIKKKEESDKQLIVAKKMYDTNEMILGEQNRVSFKKICLKGLNTNDILVQYLLLENIGRLPKDIIKYISSFSNTVINQKKLIRIEFYNNWFKTNKTRIECLLKGWSKAKLGFVLDKIKSSNNSYYNCCKQGTEKYKNHTAKIFRVRIESLIDEKGKRSNMEMYSLLLAIEKYDINKK